MPQNMDESKGYTMNGINNYGINEMNNPADFDLQLL